MKIKDKGIIYIILISVGFILTMGLLTGYWPWNIDNPYNSYALQAQSWLQGRLDLGQDYPHLELAIYQGKYFVSFPPLPSLILLPFVLLFNGPKTPDFLVTSIFTITSFIYAYKIARRLRLDQDTSILLTLFLCLGSNFVFISISGWVWFIAQTMAFGFTLAAIYYSLDRKCKKAGLSLFLLALAVGCRPLNAVFYPLIMYLIFVQYKQANPNFKLSELLKKALIWSIPTVCLAAIYMLLNFLRFGNPLEFGHNYLPEFTRSQHGQFSLQYVMKNLKDLFAFPKLKEGKLITPANGMERLPIYIVSPIVICFLASALGVFIKKSPTNRKVIAILTLLLTGLHIFVTAMHKTLGGWHFGNRYAIDFLPFIFLATIACFKSGTFNKGLVYLLFIFGFMVNIFGSVMIFNGLQ